MRKILLAAAMFAVVPLFTACTKSVDRAQRDVDRARNQAAQNVREEQRDLQDTRQDAAERVARQERRVEDAARQGTEKVIEEQRELHDARREQIRRDTDRPLPPEGAARIEVDVNRRPNGGVNVDVNRNP